MERFSLYLLFLPYPDLARDQPPFLTPHRRHVELAAPLLRALANLRTHLGDTAAAMEPDEDDMEEFGDVYFVVRKKGKHRRQKSKRSNFVAPGDLKLFGDYGASVPATSEEAAHTIASILDNQKTILQVGHRRIRTVDRPDNPDCMKQDYLDMFRDPSLASMIRGMYVPKCALVAPEPPAPVERSENVPDTREAENDEQTSAYPLVQPMKAALYFDSADGFGEWRILISTRADRDLRQARNKNPKLFKIIIKKIKYVASLHRGCMRLIYPSIGNSPEGTSPMTTRSVLQGSMWRFPYTRRR